MAFKSHALLCGRPVEHEEPIVLGIDAEVRMAEMVVRDRPMSNNEVIGSLPRRRYGAERGHMYLLPSGIVVTPKSDPVVDGYAECIVILGNDDLGHPNPTTVGGYDISVSTAELEVAREIVLTVRR